ncbi:protein O-linked-mannose beta-1,4-N-acetylglucosaminyltransferase 2-like isoform X2 [Homarus americanus]|uniref:protein O-linked-mannose beta-1,4-N-acetylglucosaminyltransferase 2-like isoform X2 n=1 Tax=Homarus americanus TaxID=6706 RepID=UPI001C4470DE|nr:protein O-linked-mannose beta-1,4-N-acetylglucosaminyltransferase 2-like isoform X2 [Homarus americanus]
MVVISKDVNLKVVLIWAVVHSTRQVSDSCIDETVNLNHNSQKLESYSFSKTMNDHKKSLLHSSLPVESSTPHKSYSSVWCYSSPESNLRCHFQNLYYNIQKKEFVFVHSLNSIIYGINNIKTLQDQLYLSSLIGHNAFLIPITAVLFTSFITKYENINFKAVHGKTLIMTRFKPDNLLHVFHDDLLPIYFTMQELCMNQRLCIEDLNLVFTDEEKRGPYWDLYLILSERIMLMSESRLNSRQVWYCFEDAYIGLNKISVWYQYGFGKPQGPQVRSSFSGHLLRAFTDFVQQRLKIEHKPTQKHLGVLISRKFNRKIVNEKELSAFIKDQLELLTKQVSEVKMLSLEENSIFTIVSELSQARVVVGVHGAALILGMFLQPGSILVEIWPFGINSNASTVYKTMCGLQDFGVAYVPWMNKDIINTVYHPEYPAAYGGLSQLSFEEQQDVIKSLYRNSLQDVACCDNTNWLFRIYQDTKVHVTEGDTRYISDPFSGALRIGLTMSREYLENNVKSKSDMQSVHPSKVQEVHCHLLKDSYYTKLLLEWKDPWNIKDINCQNIFFEVVVQIEGDSSFVSNVVSKRRFLKKIRLGVESVNTWITCFCNSIESPAFFAKCTL